MEITNQMNAPCNRLMKARRVAGFRSARAAAAALGMRPATYAAHENGSRTFSISDAHCYAELYNVSPGWILTGERFDGDRFGAIGDDPVDVPVNKNPSHEEKTSPNANEGLSDREVYDFGKQALDLLVPLVPAPEPQQSKDTINVAEVFIKRMVDPDIDPNDGEQWEFVDQWQLPSKYISDVLKVPPNDVAILAVVDDNMAPSYKIGDRLIVNFEHKKFTIDGVYFFLTEDESIHIQHIRHTRTQFILSNDNPAKSIKHPERTVDRNTVTVQGKICGIIAVR